jgi:hypothetical protein
MRRGYRAAQSFGIDCEEISPAEVQRHWPLANVADVQAEFYFPNDGRTHQDLRTSVLISPQPLSCQHANLLLVCRQLSCNLLGGDH